MQKNTQHKSLLETAKLTAIPGLTESIKKAKEEIAKGQVYSFEEVFKK